MSRLALAILALTIICMAAWSLPAISGGLDYRQCGFALVASLVWLSVLMIRLFPAPHRRAVSMRLMAVWLGATISIAVVELAAFAWPTDHLADNPWYLSTGQALVADRDLPWMRPPNLHWTGCSRGDLAMETNSADPDARVVTFQTDFEGFRNSRDLAKAEIVFIGDSFTEAGNVSEQDTFVSLTASAIDVEARNMGIAGFTPPSELIVLQKFGLKCQPRTVVWQIAETNDLDDAAFFVQWQQAGRPSVLPGFTNARPTRLEAWQRRSPSHLLFALIGEQQPWPFRGDFMDREGTEHTIRFEMSFPPDVREHPGWPVVEYSLTAGAQLLKEKNIRLVVLLIPRKLRVMAPVTDFHEFQIPTPGQPLTVKHRLPAGWDRQPEARLANHLKTLCDLLEVTFVDTTPGLTERAAAGELVYQAMDTHLSPSGHAIVSELLVDALRP